MKLLKISLLVAMSVAIVGPVSSATVVINGRPIVSAAENDTNAVCGRWKKKCVNGTCTIVCLPQ